MLFMNEKFYTVEEFAEKLRMSAQTIRRHIRAGEIFAFKIGEGKQSSYRIRESELIRLQTVGHENIKKNIKG